MLRFALCCFDFDESCWGFDEGFKRVVGGFKRVWRELSPPSSKPRAFTARRGKLPACNTDQIQHYLPCFNRGNGMLVLKSLCDLHVSVKCFHICHVISRLRFTDKTEAATFTQCGELLCLASTTDSIQPTTDSTHASGQRIHPADSTNGFNFGNFALLMILAVHTCSSCNCFLF